MFVIRTKSRERAEQYVNAVIEGDDENEFAIRRTENTLEVIGDSTISGYNPFDYIEDDDSEDDQS